MGCSIAKLKQWRNELILATGKQTLTGGLCYNNFILNLHKILAFDLNVQRKQMLNTNSYLTS